MTAAGADGHVTPMPARPDPDVIVIGAGPAGLMAAIEAGRRGRRVRLLEGGKTPARKLAFGGGVVTNRFATLNDGLVQYSRGVEHFPRFAMMRFTPTHLTDLLDGFGIGWEEREFGQIHADAAALGERLVAAAHAAGVDLVLEAMVDTVEPLPAGGFDVRLAGGGDAQAEAVVLATGGIAAPAFGGTDLGYRTAGALGIGVIGPSPALTSFFFSQSESSRFRPAIGSEVFARVTCGQHWFESRLRFLATGIAGDALRQLSTFWRAGEDLVLDLAPAWDVVAALEAAGSTNPDLPVAMALTLRMPRWVAEMVVAIVGAGRPVGALSRAQIIAISRAVHELRLSPSGTAGYAHAETTRGGVALDAIDPMTMAATDVPGLYIAGEVLDVTGWLGGYNLHWSWASGVVAGQAC